MSKSSLISNQIISFGYQEPIKGIILISDGVIQDVIHVCEDVSLFEISQRFEEWNPVIYEDCCIGPGIIDIGVRPEWDSLEALSQMAAFGGVTFLLIESNIFNTSLQRESKSYIEIGRLESLENIDGAVKASTYGFKTYLYPPSWIAKSCIADFSHSIKKLEMLQIPLIIDCMLPQDRMLFQSSPCRSMSLTERINHVVDESSNHFAGAFPDDVISDKSSENEEEAPSMTVFEKRSSALVYLSPKISHDPVRRKSERWPNLQLIERKGSLDSSFDEIDKRIKKNQGSLLFLSRLEEKSYKGSGLTTLNERVRSSSFTEEIINVSDESPPPHIDRLNIRRPAPLKICIQPAKREDSNYLNYVAKIPERWEINGVKVALSYLKKADIQVHFTKLSSAAAFNKVRKTNRKKFTCDVSCNYLFFDESDIKDGNSKFKDFPPIRSRENKQLLWDLLNINGIDLVASHHSSIPTALKTLGCGSFLQSLSGINSLGYVLQALWTLVRENESSEKWAGCLVNIFRWLSQGPAQVLKIGDRKGSIDAGKQADFVIWKPSEPCEVRNLSNNGECVYLGKELFGKVVTTIVRGHTVYKEGSYFDLT